MFLSLDTLEFCSTENRHTISKKASPFPNLGITASSFVGKLLWDQIHSFAIIETFGLDNVSRKILVQPFNLISHVLRRISIALGYYVENFRTKTCEDIIWSSFLRQAVIGIQCTESEAGTATIHWKTEALTLQLIGLAIPNQVYEQAWSLLTK